MDTKLVAELGLRGIFTVQLSPVEGHVLPTSNNHTSSLTSQIFVSDELIPNYGQWCSLLTIET